MAPGRQPTPPSQEELLELTRRAFASRGLALPPKNTIGALTLHLAELYRWNTRINLTAIRDGSTGVLRHLLESWEGVVALREAGAGDHGLLVDLGSGNGYPALGVLAGFPEWRGVLYESVGRKVDFLRSTVQRLGWTDRVEVRQERIRNAADLPTADIVTFRAFPHPETWAREVLQTRAAPTLLTWLSAQDARQVAETLDRIGCSSHILPLRSHAKGALLLARRPANGP